MHNQTCFANHMGAWAIHAEWAQKAVASIRAGTQPMTKPNDEVCKYVWEKTLRAAGASKFVWDGYNLMYHVRSGVGVISIDGPMMKFDSKYGGCNTIRTRQAVRAAMSDSDVGAILLRIESPGGTVAGTMELADDVKAAGEKKTVWAFIEDIGASAAYWVASQTGKVFANEMALVGSIGTYVEVYDTSKAADMAGVKVHVVSTGPFKGALADGTPVTDDQLADIRAIVEGLNERFLGAVSAGRGLKGAELKAVSDGRVHIAKDAKALGLVDAVRTFDDVLGELAAKVEKKSAGARSRAKASLEIDGDA